MPPITPKAVAAFQKATGTVLVLSSFQSDPLNLLTTGAGGVCRPLASLWISAGIKGGVKKGGEFANFQKIAALDQDLEACKQAIALGKKQMQDHGKLLDAFKKEANKIAKMASVQLKMDKIASDKELEKDWYAACQKWALVTKSAADDKSPLLQAPFDILAVVVSFGAATTGENLGDNGMLVYDFVKQPKGFITKPGFYYFGAGAEHAMSFYYDGKTSYFYDANTGLWRIPGGEKGFSQFILAYFKLLYQAKYDKEGLQLLFINKPLNAEVAGILAGAKTSLDDGCCSVS